MDGLEKQLKDMAQAHRPDRERMLARVERGMFEPEPVRIRPHRPRGLGRWLRAVGVTAFVAGVCAAGGYAVASAFHDSGPQQTVSTGPAAGETRSSSSSGTLWADGSIDAGSNAYWAQSDITFKNRAPLSALTVELRVAQTGGVNDTGNWRDLPSEDFTVSVREDGGCLVYRWTLKDGRTVPVGQHVFAGQYNHAEGGRDAKRDSYTVRGTTSGKPSVVHGGFA
ncbi:hypothetical protein [Streptomyces beijiangensis]|nr:hypothetical protein [Streptomyces beijiangensis]